MIPTTLPSVFTLVARDAGTRARAGLLATPHGTIETPAFMPVGTQASVKTLDQADVENLGYKLILANTYHLMLRPGLDTLRRAGGLHAFMSWKGAILTDSGGYQVYSLASRCRTDEEGVTFRSHVDGSSRSLTPESATEFQIGIGSDIAMCLDECPPYPTLRREAEASLERTLRWALRAKKTWLADMGRREASPGPLLFAIVQGAGHPDLRRLSSARTVEMGFPGYAVGGLFVGEPKGEFPAFLAASLEPLPWESPRYLMGAGQPGDLWEAVGRGVDLFDCALPTRNARNGQAFTRTGKLNLRNSEFREDFSPVEPECVCPTCRRYTRSYISHLFRAGEILAGRLVTLHNLAFMLALTRRIRQAVVDGRFEKEKRRFLSEYRKTDEE